MPGHSQAGRPTFEDMAVHGEALLREGGVSALTARALASRAGIALGSIYSIVPGGMERLVEAMNARLLRRLVARLRAAAEGAGGGRGERAGPMLSAYLDFARSEAAGWSLLISHSLPEGERESKDFADAREEAMDAIATLLVMPSRLEVAALWASLHGAVSLSLAGKLAGGHDLETVAARILRGFVPEFR